MLGAEVRRITGRRGSYWSAIALGFTSVMMDGSLKEDGKTPTTFDENVEVTRRVVEYAHERGITVEGEIGVLGGVEDGHGAGGTGLEHITDPDQAVEFAERRSNPEPLLIHHTPSGAR